MTTRFEIEKTNKPDGPLVRFGPIDSSTGNQLAIPSEFERVVTQESTQLSLRVSCYFSGERIEVSSLCVQAPKGSAVTTRDLFQLGLPEVIRAIAKVVVPDFEKWSVEDNALTGSHAGTYVFLAQMYWLEHVSYGNPRQALMTHLSKPRSTTSVLIRKLNADFGLPGAVSAKEATA